MKEIKVNGITYKVKKPCNNTYILHGPRGATYQLLRTIPRPEILFAVNANRGFKPVSKLGWFTDRKGFLESIEIA